MAKFIWQDGQWVPADRAAVQRVVSTGVGIIRDFAEPLMCPADGKMHGTRRTYDAAVREAGCEIIGRAEGERMRQRGNRLPQMDSPRELIRQIVNG